MPALAQLTKSIPTRTPYQLLYILQCIGCRVGLSSRYITQQRVVRVVGWRMYRNDSNGANALCGTIGWRNRKVQESNNFKWLKLGPQGHLISNTTPKRQKQAHKVMHPLFPFLKKQDSFCILFYCSYYLFKHHLAAAHSFSSLFCFLIFYYQLC